MFEDCNDSIVLGYSLSTCGDENRSSIFERTPMNNGLKSITNRPLKTTSSIFSHSSHVASNTHRDITLKNWYLQPMKGSHSISVYGQQLENGKLQRSGAITTRVNSRCVLTAKGSMYKLIGPIQHAKNMPKWLEKKFCYGFPSLWKGYMEEYLDWLHERSSDVNSDDDVAVNPLSSEDPSPTDEISNKMDLYQWSIRICGEHTLIEGYQKAADGKLQLYRTGPVVDVCNRTLIYTANRSTYCLNGVMCLEAAVQGGLPLWFAKKFNEGFPETWQDLVAKYVSFKLTGGSSFQSNEAFEFSCHSSIASCEIPCKDSGDFSYRQESCLFASRCSLSDVEEEFNVSMLSTDIHKLPSVCTQGVENCHVNERFSSSSGYETPAGKSPVSVSNKFFAKAKRSKNPKTAILHKPLIEVTNNQQTGKLKKENSRKNRSKNLKAVRIKASKAKNVYTSETEPSTLSVCFSTSATAGSNHSLYRTRSGRHVFPPLQNWTCQRLVSEVDENGIDVVRFYPGTESVLSTVSPVCEALRKAEWIHRQFEQDQIMNIPSPVPASTKTSRRKASNLEKKSCIKKIFSDAPVGTSAVVDILENQNILPEDAFEGVVHEEKVEAFQPESIKLSGTDLKRNVTGKDATSNIVQNLCKLPQQQMDSEMAFANINTSKEKTQMTEREKRKFDDSGNRNLDKSANSTTKFVSRYNLRKRKSTGSKMPSPLLTKQRFKENKQKWRKLQEQTNGSVKSTKCQKRKACSKHANSSSELISARHALKEISNMVNCCETVQIRVLQPNIVLEKIRTNKQRNDEKVPEDIPKLKRSLKKRKAVKSNPNQENISIDNSAPSGKTAQKESIEVTAKHGTLKHRKQMREVLATINEGKNVQDFFTDKLQENSLNTAFDAEAYKLDSQKQFTTPFTPVSKLPTDFDKYVATPAWFQTPNSADAFVYTDAETPSHLKLDLPSIPVQSETVVDRLVLQMQKRRRKKPSYQRRAFTPKHTQKPRKNHTVHPELLKVEPQQEPNSSFEDEYFST